PGPAGEDATAAPAPERAPTPHRITWYPPPRLQANPQAAPSAARTAPPLPESTHRHSRRPNKTWPARYRRRRNPAFHVPAPARTKTGPQTAPGRPNLSIDGRRPPAPRQ